LKKQYNIDEISFEDDNLTLDANRIEEICDQLIKRKINIHWTTPNGVYIHSLNEKLLKKIKKSGCYKLCFGIESGDKDVLNYMRKPVNLKKAQEVIKICNKIGIWTHGFFVIGTPAETKKSIKNTLSFAKRSGLDFASFLIAMPYPGTDLEKDMKVVDYEKLKVMHATRGVKNFTANELNDVQKSMYSEFAKHKLLTLMNPYNMYKYLKKPYAFRMSLRTLNRFLQLTKK
jgi:magnesium-protoporphyrin IX monomethyl ester (oxidative) cyclase